MDITSIKIRAGLRDSTGFRERKGHGPSPTVPKYHIVTEQNMAKCRPNLVTGIKIDSATIIDAHEVNLEMRCNRGDCALTWKSM